tara:strand:+ start:820 stop:1086 length:267 start_codon:yes stop_codon:yes gene_type:complete
MSYKVTKLSDAAAPSMWDAHVNKAASSPVQAREYKKSGYVLDSDRIMADKIRNGEVIGEGYLKGETKKRLKKFQRLTEADFIKYGDYE